MKIARLIESGILGGGGAGDAIAPTVVITCDQESPTYVSPITFTATFSEDVTGFVVGDFGIANGTKGTFTAVSASVYTLSVVPDALATVTATVAAEVCEDAGGNLNEAAEPLAIVSTIAVLDNFTDTRAAGAVHNTAATPGPGTRTVVDTESQVTVGSGVLAVAGGLETPATGDPGLWYGAQSRAQGLAAYLKIPAVNAVGLMRGVGWDTNQSGDGTYFINLLNAGTIGTEQKVWESISATADLEIMLVLQSTGQMYFLKGSTGISEWALMYRRVDGADATLYPACINNNKVANIDTFRVGKLGGAFGTLNGIATQILTGARSTSDAGTAEADSWQFFTVTTLPSSGNISYRFRKQDATNYWEIYIDSSGAIQLNEIASGSPTTRASGTGIANGAVIGIRMHGSDIFVVSNTTTKCNFTSNSYKTSTAWTLSDLGTGGAVSQIEVWPFTLSGAALAEVAAFTTFLGIEELTYSSSIES